MKHLFLVIATLLGLCGGLAWGQNASNDVKFGTWDEAIASIKCEAVKKNEDGTWTVTSSLYVGDEKLSKVAGDHAAALAKKCSCKHPGSLALMGVGC